MTGQRTLKKLVLVIRSDERCQDEAGLLRLKVYWTLLLLHPGVTGVVGGMQKPMA